MRRMRALLSIVLRKKMSEISNKIKQLLTPVVQGMQSYHVPDASGFIKLDAMENPYTWDDSLKQQWLDVIRSAEINRYPNPAADELRAKISEVMDVPQGLEIMLGNGSDEIIQILTMAMATDDASMLSVEPSFVMYKVIADTVGMDFHSVLLNDDYSLDTPAILAAVKEHQPSLLFFAVPNNPTGNCFSEADLRSIIELSEGLVIIDEAYIAFTDADMLQLAVDYDNVLIMRTLSKVGLAGLRLGMLIGKAAWIEQFNKIRLPYNINVLTQLTALFALEHYGMLLDQAELIKDQRSNLIAALADIEGVQAFESQANFVLIRIESDAKVIFEKLKEQGVLVKCLSGAHPLLNNCLRITVSTVDENKQFISSLKATLKVS